MTDTVQIEAAIAIGVPPSIVGGYYGATRDLFARKANVYSGGTTDNDAHPDWRGIADKYIEKGRDHGWDIIQFNRGCML